MNERRIQRVIMRDRYNRNLVLPNHTPKDWYECDVFELTKAGYFREYEIKVTVSDYKADALKGASLQLPGDKPVLSKHKRLSMGFSRAPRQFWFVTPKGLLDGIEIPEWAGHIEIGIRGRSSYYMEEVKKARFLHRQKAVEEVRTRALNLAYYRFHDMLLKTKI